MMRSFKEELNRLINQGTASKKEILAIKKMIEQVYAFDSKQREFTFDGEKTFSFCANGKSKNYFEYLDLVAPIFLFEVETSDPKARQVKLDLIANFISSDIVFQLFVEFPESLTSKKREPRNLYISLVHFFVDHFLCLNIVSSIVTTNKLKPNSEKFEDFLYICERCLQSKLAESTRQYILVSLATYQIYDIVFNNRVTKKIYELLDRQRYEMLIIPSEPNEKFFERMIGFTSIFELGLKQKKFQEILKWIPQFSWFFYSTNKREYFKNWYLEQREQQTTEYDLFWKSIEESHYITRDIICSFLSKKWNIGFDVIDHVELTNDSALNAISDIFS